MRVDLTITAGPEEDGERTFTVTRDVAGTDRDPVTWVHVQDQLDDPSQQDDAPVAWGTNASLQGEATLPVTGSGTAWATLTPWRVRRSDPSVDF